MSPESPGLVTLGWSLPPQYPHLRRRSLDSTVRRASSSITVSQAVTFVGRRNRFLQCLCPCTGDRREETWEPRAQGRGRGGAEGVSKEIKKQGHQGAVA